MAEFREDAATVSGPQGGLRSLEEQLALDDLSRCEQVLALAEYAMERAWWACCEATATGRLDEALRAHADFLEEDRRTEEAVLARARLLSKLRALGARLQEP